MAYIFQRPFLRGLSTKGNLHFKIDWASLIVGSKFTVFVLFYFVYVFEDNFPSTSLQGLILILEGQFNVGFFVLPDWGLVFGGAYTWRGLFSEFYSSLKEALGWIKISHIPNVGFWGFAGEFCDLWCLMNTLPWDEFDRVINPANVGGYPSPTGQMSCFLDTN